MTNKEIIKDLFSRLKPLQQKMFRHFFGSDNRKQVFHCSRRVGKTYLLCVVSSVVALSGPRKQIRFATFTNKSLKKMILPIMRELWEIYPKVKQPVFNSSDSVFTFPNGSQIHLAGVNNGRADVLRGTSADLCLIDESGFVEELSYLVESVLLPQLITSDSGKLIMASSSPLSPAHEFVDYINAAKLSNSYQSFDIYSSGYDEKIIKEFCKEAGGPESSTWRREYLNEIITDDQLAIIPEWDSSKYVSDFKPDEYHNYHLRYESMDLGVRDKTAILFGHYRFNEAKLYIDREWTCSGQDSTTRNIADNIKRIESELQSSNPYRRIADNNSLITLQDLSKEFDIHFSPTSKDSLSAMVNEVRLWVQSGRIVVHSSCKELIACLEFGVFQDEKRNMFGRSKSLGHFDLLASLIYLVRNIDQHTNPIPKTHGYSSKDLWIGPDYEQIEKEENIKKIFNL